MQVNYKFRDGSIYTTEELIAICDNLAQKFFNNMNIRILTTPMSWITFHCLKENFGWNGETITIRCFVDSMVQDSHELLISNGVEGMSRYLFAMISIEATISYKRLRTINLD